MPNFLHTTLREKLGSNQNLQKALTNIGWLFLDRILRMGMGVVVGVWLARHLGPEQFGIFNYAIAFVSLFASVASLGLNGVVVHKLIRHPEEHAHILGSAFVLQALGGLCASLLAIIAVDVARPGDTPALILVSILSLGLIFKAADVIKYWFESQVQSKYVVWLGNGVFLLVALLKIGLILANAPLVAFAWVTLFEAVLVSVGLFFLYAHRGNLVTRWQPHYQRAISLLKESWPLILSGLAVMVYMRIDQIMIGQILDDHAVGIYSAAVRISELWYFIPTTIVASIFPSIVEAKKLDEAIYRRRLQRLCDLLLLVALAVAVPVSMLSEWIVVELFGSAYLGAGAILAIHIWAGIFVALGTVGSRWYLIEGFQRLLFARTLLGALLNVFMNLALIPSLGLRGAAIATVTSYGIAAFLSDGLHKNTRTILAIKARSFYKNSFLTKAIE